MRIAIINLTGGSLSGGYRKYLQNILPLMQADNRVTSLDVFIPQQEINTFLNNSNLNSVNWHKLPTGNFITLFKVLKREMLALNPDVVFVPTAIPMPFGSLPVVTMIQNMEPMVAPFNGNPFRESIKNIAISIATRLACKRADRVIAMSKYVRDHLLKKWNILQSRIGLVYHGTENHSNPICPVVPRPLNGLENFRFLFTAGSIRPARGLEDIIASLKKLGPDYSRHVVIAGKAEPAMEPYLLKLKNLAQRLGVAELIHWVGQLSTEEMSWCFLNSDMFIMTSRVETFGHTAVEAMSFGCACISANNSCLPEVFSDAAILYRPRDSRELAKRIKEVLAWDTPRKKAMSEKAKKRAAFFSWEVCAQKTVTELRKALI